MSNPRIRRPIAAFTLALALGLLPAAEAGSLSRSRWEEPVVAQRHFERGFLQTFWSLLTSFWAKSGAKIDGNG